MKRTHKFYDAHPEVRCRQTITLKDGSTARCGRMKSDDLHKSFLDKAHLAFGYCHQHGMIVIAKAQQEKAS